MYPEEHRLQSKQWSRKYTPTHHQKLSCCLGQLVNLIALVDLFYVFGIIYLRCIHTCMHACMDGCAHACMYLRT